jgi:hypothetical protein
VREGGGKGEGGRGEEDWEEGKGEMEKAERGSKREMGRGRCICVRMYVSECMCQSVCVRMYVWQCCMCKGVLVKVYVSLTIPQRKK